jgi:hypothetical protein
MSKLRITGWGLFILGIIGFLAFGGPEGLRTNTAPTAISAGIAGVGMIVTIIDRVLYATQLVRQKRSSKPD